MTAPLIQILANIRLKWLIFTLLVFALLIKLAWWQNSRADEKQQRLVRIVQLSDQQAFTLDQVVTQLLSKGKRELINDLPIAIKATFDSDKVFLLDNQSYKNQLGYRVFQLAYQGKYAFLVNLGWVKGFIAREKLPEIPHLIGEQKFLGHVRIPEQGILLQAQNFTQPQWPLRVQQIELDKFAMLLKKNLLPFVVYADKEATIGFIKDWQPIVMPPEKHQAYAVQWLLLAIAWLVLMVSALIKSSNNNNNKKRVN